MNMGSNNKVLSPRNATSYKKILQLGRTVVSTRKSWLHLGHDGKVFIVNQSKGEQSMGSVTLSRADFERFVKFYEKAQKVRKA
jgi:hypothetical protein